MDSNFEMCNFLLEQEEFEEPHNYKTISAKLDEVFTRYGIEKSIKTIGSDNASNMVKGIKVLIKYYQQQYGVHILHVRCAAHIFHLICGEFIKSEKVKFS